jgi:hypothetical protein
VAAAQLNVEALGPTRQADASGGQLRQLLAAASLRNQLEQPLRRRPFRGKRAVLPGLY